MTHDLGAVIDLGEARPVAAVPSGAEFSWRRMLAGPGTRWWRRIGVPLVAVALVAASAGPARSYLGRGIEIPIGAAANMLITADRVIVVDYAHGETDVSAFDLSNGHRLWRSRLAIFSGGVSVYVTGSVVLVTGVGGDSPVGTAGQGAQTQAFDLATGKPRWSSQQTVEAITTSGYPLMIGFTPDSTQTRLSAVDASDGRPVWLHVVPAGCDWVYRADDRHRVDELAQACLAGSAPAPGSPPYTYALSLIDTDTGATVATAHQNGLALPPGLNFADPGLQFVPGLLLVLDLNGQYAAGSLVDPADAGAPTSRVTAYRDSDLGHLWTLSDVGVGESVSECVPGRAELCRVGVTGVTVLDPATGRNTGTPPPSPPQHGYVLVPTGAKATLIGTIGLDTMPAGLSFAVPGAVAGGRVWLARDAGHDRVDLWRR